MKNIIPSLAYFVRKLELINPSMKKELAEITTGLISINTFSPNSASCALAAADCSLVVFDFSVTWYGTLPASAPPAVFFSFVSFFFPDFFVSLDTMST